MGEVDFTGILVLELFQAAARAAVAQAFPFGVGHFFQRLGFPKESLLTRGRLGLGGHDSLTGRQWFEPFYSVFERGGYRPRKENASKQEARSLVLIDAEPGSGAAASPAQ